MIDFDFFLSQSGLNIYIFLFLSLLAGAFGLPIPEDIPLVAAGVLLHERQTKLIPTFIICYIGIIVGDLIIYFAGRFFGPALIKRKWFQRKISKIGLKKVRSKLENRSLLTIFIARHLFWIRTATFLICGIVRIKPIKFIVADAIAASISIPIMISIGYFSYEKLDNAFGHVKKAEHLLLVAVLIVIAIILAYKTLFFFVRRHMEKRSDS